jgi:hypothetical protein
MACNADRHGKAVQSAASLWGSDSLPVGSRRRYSIGRGGRCEASVFGGGRWRPSTAAFCLHPCWPRGSSVKSSVSYAGAPLIRPGSPDTWRALSVADTLPWQAIFAMLGYAGLAAVRLLQVHGKSDTIPEELLLSEAGCAGEPKNSVPPLKMRVENKLCHG